jgi:hypothetical protein
MRMNGKQFPLSPEEAAEALRDNRIRYNQTDPADRDGLDYKKLAAFSLTARSEYLPADRLNELVQ